MANEWRMNDWQAEHAQVGRSHTRSVGLTLSPSPDPQPNPDANPNATPILIPTPCPARAWTQVGRSYKQWIGETAGVGLLELAPLLGGMAPGVIDLALTRAFS